MSIWEPSKGKSMFVRAIPRNGLVLDVGCGNNSPEWFKMMRPDIYYVGLDVGNYNQTNDPYRFADEYVLTTSREFAQKIRELHGRFHAVVSSHNLEHCNEPDAVLSEMIAALRPGGRLYLAFPCEASVHFPRRDGCLNFFDDSTHKTVPRWDNIRSQITRSGLKVEFAARRYRPFPLILRGAFLEPKSAITRKVVPDGSTWALYGFESVIWATAPSWRSH